MKSEIAVKEEVSKLKDRLAYYTSQRVSKRKGFDRASTNAIFVLKHQLRVLEWVLSKN